MLSMVSGREKCPANGSYSYLDLGDSGQAPHLFRLQPSRLSTKDGPVYLTEMWQNQWVNG